MTITQTVDIPANRRLTVDFEIPREVTADRARVILQFPISGREGTPVKSVKKTEKIRLTEAMIEEMVRNSPTLHELTGILKTDMTVDEIREERLAKYL